LKTHSLKHEYTTHARRSEKLSRTKLRTGHKSSYVAKIYDHYTMEDEVELVERLKFPELNKYLDEPLTMPIKRKPTAIAEKLIKRMVGIVMCSHEVFRNNCSSATLQGSEEVLAAM
jgi:hypothetical protein